MSIQSTSLSLFSASMTDSRFARVDENVLIRILQYAGPEAQENASRVCKYLNSVVNQNIFHKDCVNRLLTISFFASSRLSRIFTSDEKIQSKISTAYRLFFQRLAIYEIPVQVKHPRFTPTEMIRNQNALLEAKILLCFCRSLSPYLQSKLPSLSQDGLTEEDQAARLREDLKNSPVIQSTMTLSPKESELHDVPKEISLFAKLFRFDIRNQMITSLPDSMSEMTELESVFIYQTPIVDFPSNFIPSDDQKDTLVKKI